MDLKNELTEKAMVFMKTVANRSGDPFYTVSPGDSFRFVFVNDAACRHFGRSRQELLRMRLADIDAQMPQERWREVWQEIREKGAIFFETVHRHADGHDIPVAVSANLFAEAGRELFGGCIHDLSQEKLTEEALRESEEMLRVVFNSTYDSILLHRGDGTILDANESFLRMHGIDLDRALRLRIADLSAPSMSMDEAAAIWNRVLAGEPHLFEWKGRRVADGSEFDLEIFLRKIRIKGEDAILANLRDISARKRAETALVQAKSDAEAGNRAKDRFLLNMSHELRTPLTITLGMLELALQNAASPAIRHYLEAACRSSETLLTLVSDILDLSRIERGEEILDESTFDLPGCIREVIGPSAGKAAEKGLVLHLQLDRDLPPLVTGDCARLKQILQNLVENAVRFTDRGEIQVSVRPGADFAGKQEVLFSVCDTGIGIPEKALGLLFRRFTQVDDSLTRRFGGSGLGLSLSRGLVEHMGGRIGVESEEGRGSTFSFVLPFQVPAVRETAIGGETGAGRRTRILLAEDEPLLREMVRTALQMRGWEVDVADSGRQAVARWQKGGVDLVLMDLQMPEMNGLEATRAIREMEGAEEGGTCIIAFSAHVDSRIREECRESGADDFVAKPIRISELCTAVEKCLKQRSRSYQGRFN